MTIAPILDNFKIYDNILILVNTKNKFLLILNSNEVNICTTLISNYYKPFITYLTFYNKNNILNILKYNDASDLMLIQIINNKIIYLYEFENYNIDLNKNIYLYSKYDIQKELSLFDLDKIILEICKEYLLNKKDYIINNDFLNNPFSLISNNSTNEEILTNFYQYLNLKQYE